MLLVCLLCFHHAMCCIVKCLVIVVLLLLCIHHGMCYAMCASA